MKSVVLAVIAAFAYAGTAQAQSTCGGQDYPAAWRRNVERDLTSRFQEGNFPLVYKSTLAQEKRARNGASAFDNLHYPLVKRYEK